MLTDQGHMPSIRHAVLQHWSLTLIAFFGGRSHQHWLVESEGSRLVPRGLGWPVPVPVAEPLHVWGRT
jgi:hypothetical protein